MDRKKETVYVSIDCEATGPAPGIHSLLSIGCAAFNINRELLATFERNFVLLPNTTSHPKTDEFWRRFPEMLAMTRVNQIEPKIIFKELEEWLNGLKVYGTPIFMAYPARFDLRWVDYYSWRFLDTNLLGLSALDIKTAASIILKKPFHNTVKQTMPKRWFTSDKKHTHNALDDAIEQGELGINMLRQGFELVPI